GWIVGIGVGVAGLGEPGDAWEGAGRCRTTRVAGHGHRAGHHRLAPRVDVPGNLEAGTCGDVYRSRGDDGAEHRERATGRDRHRDPGLTSTSSLVERRQRGGVEE